MDYKDYRECTEICMVSFDIITITCVTFNTTFPYFFEKSWILVDFKKISGKILGLLGKGTFILIVILCFYFQFSCCHQ
jgi:hypothetical protein